MIDAGGKASALFTDLLEHRNSDEFMANEPSEHRARLVTHVIPSENVMVHSGQELPALGIAYDRIIIDAPCTGLGALRRRPEARWRRTPQDLKELVKIQKELLAAGLQLLKPGGVLAYVTCSPHLLETKAQVLEVLHRNKDLELVNITPYLPDSVPNRVVTSEGTLQLWTQADDADSMFMALFTRN